MNSNVTVNEDSRVEQLVRDAQRAAKKQNVKELHDIADILQERHGALHEACRVRHMATDLMRKLQVEA
jgi:hypothetical protein